MHQPAMQPNSCINATCVSEAQRCPVVSPNNNEVCSDHQLFRQAIVERKQEAWERIYQNYSPLVFSWVINHPCFWKMGEDAAYFVNRAFEKMWVALTPDKFAHFYDLPSLLKYLQTCVHSVVIDHARKLDQRARTLPFDADPALEPADPVQAVERALEEMWWAEVWKRIRRRLSKREERLLYYRFICDLKPRQICEQFPEDFADVNEVYCLLQNVLGRLRRDQELKVYFSYSQLQ
ncbi:MAG: sigma-70 family RNA polymerase sigma factor [Caldilineaceae bacterium]